MSSIKEQNIWYPWIYEGRQGDYAKKITEVDIDQIVELVQKRVEEDGESSISNGLVGENKEHEPVMRKLMSWASNETNIRQCVRHLLDEAKALEANSDYEPRTVDFVCRDLANAAKWIGGSRG